MNIYAVSVVREEWLALLVKAEPHVAANHKPKWADLKLGADRARGHRLLYVNESDRDLIQKYANESIQGQSGKKLGS